MVPRPLELTTGPLDPKRRVGIFSRVDMVSLDTTMGDKVRDYYTSCMP